MPVTLTLDEAAAELHAGHVVAVPTESVYGLTADPTQENALRALLALKARDPSKGFILVASTIEALNDWIEPFTPDMATRILPTWPLHLGCPCETQCVHIVARQACDIGCARDCSPSDEKIVRCMWFRIGVNQCKSRRRTTGTQH